MKPNSMGRCKRVLTATSYAAMAAATLYAGWYVSVIAKYVTTSEQADVGRKVPHEVSHISKREGIRAGSSPMCFSARNNEILLWIKGQTTVKERE